MIKFRDLHKKWMNDPVYRKEYEGLEEEFALMAEVAKARGRSGLSQAELAKRMQTTQSVIARLESGRGLPSTRTLSRFAKATGHRLKISFVPVKARAKASPSSSPPKAGTHNHRSFCIVRAVVMDFRLRGNNSAERARRSLDFFKREAKKQRVPYQRMIRSLVDLYAERQEGKERRVGKGA